MSKKYKTIDDYQAPNDTQVQGDQLYMAMCFWYSVKSDLSDVRVYCSVHWTSHILKGTNGHLYVVE